MQILNQRQIQQKVTRLAYEILERNFAANRIILAGINNNGYHFAELLQVALQNLSKKEIKLCRIRLNPAAPDAQEVALEWPVEEIRDETIIIVDDLANTGRTLFFAFKPLLETLPKKLEVAVLVDRKHKSFPVKVDYVGLSLATTLLQHIEVQLDGEQEAVFLS